MNILNCTVCFPEYVQGTVYWPPLPVPSLIVETPANVSLNIYQYYNYYNFSAITTVPESATWVMFLAGLAILVILKRFRRQ